MSAALSLSVYLSLSPLYLSLLPLCLCLFVSLPFSPLGSLPPLCLSVHLSLSLSRTLELSRTHSLSPVDPCEHRYPPRLEIVPLSLL